MAKKGRYTYDYPRGATTVDCVVFGADVETRTMKVVLIKRRDDPFKGRWALPGGFLEEDEDIEAGARRELLEETGIEISYLEQLYTFGSVHRDPRERVISVAHFALVRSDAVEPEGGDDAVEAEWVDLIDTSAKKLAFDHADILAMAVRRLRAKVRYEPIGFSMLPVRFTMTELRRLYETILDKEIDSRNFRKQMTRMGVLVEAGRRTGVAGPPPALFSFDKKKYDAAVMDGFNFEI